jgi:hypothetical protein
MHEKIAGSKLVILPNSGHMNFVDQPEMWQKAVTKYSHGTPYAATFFSAARCRLGLLTRLVNPAASFTAMSARILRSSSMPAFFRPLMNCE